MIIRKAMLEDLKKCAKVDGTLQTDRIFRLSAVRENDKYHIKLEAEPLATPTVIQYIHNPDRLNDTVRDGEVIVSDDNGKIVGYSEIRLVKWNKSCWVINVVVDNAYRKQGVATKMMERVKLSAKEFGMRTLMFDGSMLNYPVYKFCLKNGFRICGMNDSYYPDNTPALFMCYNLE